MGEGCKVWQLLYHSDSLLVVAIEEGGLGAIDAILLEDLGGCEEPAHTAGQELRRASPLCLCFLAYFE